jgi:phosphatidylinositol-3-phosphatase
MGSLKDIRISWPAFATLVAISAAATLFILAGGGGPSAAQEAGLAALKHPPKVYTPSGSGNAGNRSDGPSGNGGSNSSGNSGSGNSGFSPGGSNSDTSSTPTQTSTTPASINTAPKSKHKSHHHKTPAPDAGLPHVGHVFEIALSNSGYGTAFGKSSDAKYLNSLVGKGALLSNYQSFANSSELTDYIAMLSGQGPDGDTDNGCPVYKSFPSSATANTGGIVSGDGCIYPDTALTLADQTGIAGQTWGAYIQSMGAKTSCQFPDPGVRQNKGIVGTEPGYSLNHNPFVYFESLLEEGSCDSSDLDLSFLPKALNKVKSTPNFTYIAPNECADSDPVIAPSADTSTGTVSTTTTTPTTTTPTGTTAPAVGCPSGDPNGIGAEDTFLKTVVPEILKSKAYKADGVLVITFANSGDKGVGQMVRTGTLVLSKYTKHGVKVGGAYGPYSLLRSVEDMLDYQPLANAATAPSFAKKVL